MYDILIVGCGLSGAVLAERLASQQDKKILIVDKRDHIGGNCFDYINEVGIRVHRYGPHLFHTSSERVWEYVNRFSEWSRWEHKVLGCIDGQFVPIPPGISTVNTVCGTHIKTEEEMQEWLKEHQIPNEDPKNGEEMALSRVGHTLYEKIFKYYTFKQWGVYPDQLNASVLARIPVRCNFDIRYFSDKYQALPTNGYTAIFEKMLDHPNIRVRLDVDYFSERKSFKDIPVTVYTGPIDRYFAGTGLPMLQYRSLRFQTEHLRDCGGYFQPVSQVNYPGNDVPYTRIVEYKHLLNQQSPHTTIVYETSSDEGEPFYPVPNADNQDLYTKYQALAKDIKNVHFVGRLANYKYFNMDQAILNALEYYDNNLHVAIPTTDDIQS